MSDLQLDLDINHLTVNKIYFLLNKTPDPNKFTKFIETGTYKAHSTMEASKVFQMVYTIELSTQLFLECKEKCKDINNIKLYHGDSLRTLGEMILEIDEPSFWFLDAHISGTDTVCSTHLVPLIEELKIILNHISNMKKNNIIVIDDVRLFTQAHGWDGVSIPIIRRLFNQYKLHVQDEYLFNDKYVIYV